MRLIVLDGDPFSIGDLADIAHRRATVDVGEIGSKRAADSAAVLSSHAASGEAIYGVNTGFGPLKSVAIPSSDLEALQLNLIRSHAVGVGPPLGEPEVRAAMALLAASHLRGSSGVDSSAAKLICELLNNNELPRVPSQGSLGASGDLAPLAHIALFLIENGLKIAPKLGLSLINGTHVHTALAALLTHESVMLAKAADIACAMNLEATLGSRKPFDASVHKLRPHPHQQIAARNLWALTEGSAIMQSHANCGEVQDAYSFRCAPQVHGASRHAIASLREIAEIELGSVTDNPLVVDNELISAGHFHGQPVGLALDYFKIGIAEFASISERRIERVLNPTTNRGLPAFLASHPGLESGMMICQYTAAALVSDNKVLAHPSCVDSIPTGANQEDHVSMAMNAALHAQRVLANVRNVIAIELLVAAQALDCRAKIQPDKPGDRVQRAWSAIRKQSKTLDSDRSLSNEIQSLDLDAIVSAAGDLE